MLRISSGLQAKLLGGSGAGSLQTLLSGGVLRVYAGTQPADADTTEGSAVLLGEVSLNGGTFIPGAGGASTNGLTFDDPASGDLNKAAAEVWQGSGVADGSAGWFRFYDSNRTTGASTTAVRLDGVIATSGGELTMTNTAIAVGTPIILNTFVATLPKS